MPVINFLRTIEEVVGNSIRYTYFEIMLLKLYYNIMEIIMEIMFECITGLIWAKSLMAF